MLLSKSRTSGTPNVWLIDPNPQDIGMIDFYRPDGTPVAVVRGDPRQLNDATFHAGTNSESEYEYVDTFNKLHFYVIDTWRDEDKVLRYQVAVRRYDNGDPFLRGVTLAKPTKAGLAGAGDGVLKTCTFPLRNTGTAGAAPFDQDVYRVSATSSSADWTLTLPNALTAAKAGELVKVRVHAGRGATGAATTTVTLTATSESDPSKTATRTCDLQA